jgi:hypothetical protein
VLLVLGACCKDTAGGLLLLLYGCWVETERPPAPAGCCPAVVLLHCGLDGSKGPTVGVN